MDVSRSVYVDKNLGSGDTQRGDTQVDLLCLSAYGLLRKGGPLHLRDDVNLGIPGGFHGWGGRKVET